MNQTQSLQWTPARDETFFRLTGRLFSPAFVAGAGVLLASYDIPSDELTDGAPALAEPTLARPLIPGQRSSATTAEQSR